MPLAATLSSGPGAKERANRKNAKPCITVRSSPANCETRRRRGSGGAVGCGAGVRNGTALHASLIGRPASACGSL